jgi:hypothetical protein
MFPFKFLRAAGSLSDVDSHFFANHKTSIMCTLFNVCFTAQQYIGMDWKALFRRESVLTNKTRRITADIINIVILRKLKMEKLADSRNLIHNFASKAAY